MIVLGKKLGSNIVGVTFHVGVGCLDIEAFSRGIKSIKELFDFAETIGYEFKIVDIGEYRFVFQCLLDFVLW